MVTQIVTAAATCNFACEDLLVNPHRTPIRSVWPTLQVNIAGRESERE